MTALKTGVIGWPVNHSKSPLIHGHWLDAYGILGQYTSIPVAPDALKTEVARLVREGYAGFNVTVPHKQAVMDLMDYMRADAERIGAVNTVVINPDGTLEGRNTDAYGFMENLKSAAPGWNAASGPAIIIGAGGAARAIVYALQKAGAADIRIVNRTLSRARELADAFKPATGHAWEALPDLTRDAALVVNTTTLGMGGHPPLEVDFDRVHENAVICDIVYTPLMTPFLTGAKDAGRSVVTGIGMLLHQARPAFQAWYGVLPDVDDALIKKVLA